MQTIQLPKNNNCLPLGHTDYYNFINLACQVSPLEDTLVSTKGRRATANCRTQQEISTPHPHDSNPASTMDSLM